MQLQILLNLVKTKPWHCLAAAYSLAAICSFFLTKPDTSPIDFNSREDEWDQSGFLTPRSTPEHFAYLKQNPIWGKASTPSATPQEQGAETAQVKWTLKGVISQGDAFVAIIEQPSADTRTHARLATSATLANGEKIVEIRPSGITVKMPDGTQKEIRLHQSQTN
jgi:hypothetical protein